MENTKETITINAKSLLGKDLDIDSKILELKKLEQLEDITLRDLTIDNDIVNILNSKNKLKRLFLINCNISCNVLLKKLQSLEVYNCKNIENIKTLDLQVISVEECDYIDIKNILNYNLISIQIIDTKIKNICEISKFKNLKELSLNEVDITEVIEINKMEQLKHINFDGSYVQNIENYKSQCGKNIQFSIRKEFNKVG